MKKTHLDREFPGVLRVNTEIVLLDSDDIGIAVQEVSRSAHRRARICAHPGDTSKLHEMFIVLDEQTYIRPHKHLHAVESFHLISGSAVVLFFTEAGNLIDKVRLGDYQSKDVFYYRMPPNQYHALLITSPQAIVHEVVEGPRDPEATAFAPWSPPGSEATLGLGFLRSF